MSTIGALKCVGIYKENIVCVNIVSTESLPIVCWAAIAQHSASAKLVPQTGSWVRNLKWPTRNIRQDCLVFTLPLTFGTFTKGIWPLSSQLRWGKSSKPLSNVSAVKITSNCTSCNYASSPFITVVSSKCFLLLLYAKNARSCTYLCRKYTRKLTQKMEVFYNVFNISFFQRRAG